MEEEKKKKEQEAKDAAAKDAAGRDAQKKKEDEERKKKEDEARKKKEEEEKRKKAAEKEAAEAVEEPEISDDFVTVTTAEIFMKQGLLTEAEKILNKILVKEPDNMEARMRLNELKKLLNEFAEEDKKSPAPGDDDKGTKGSKVSYI